MTLPEYRCLICDMVLAEPGETRPTECCTQCGKNVLSNQPAMSATRNEGPPVIPASPPSIPDNSPLAPNPVLDEVPLAMVVEPPVPRQFPVMERKTQAETFLPQQQQQSEKPKPKVAFALFIAFITIIAILACFVVLAYAVVRGLKKVTKPMAAVTVVAPEKETASTEKTPGSGKPMVILPPPVTARVWEEPKAKPKLISIAKENATIPLPAKASGGVYAGGGRYVLFHMPSANKIAVFDVVDTKIVGDIPAPEKAFYAATADRAFVLDPATRMLSRFKLDPPEAELEEKLDEKIGIPRAMTAGHNSGGPLAILADSGGLQSLNLVSAETLKSKSVVQRSSVPGEEPFGVFSGAKSGPGFLRSSADGRTLLGGLKTALGDYQVDLAKISGDSIFFSSLGESLPGSLSPTSDGRIPANGFKATRSRFPMSGGGGFFEIETKAESPTLTYTFAAESCIQRGELSNVEDFAPAAANADRRAFLIPYVNAFVYLTSDYSALRIRKLDVFKSVQTPNAILIYSSPPLTAARGTLWRYPLVVKPESAPPSYRLDSPHPDGMKFEKNELVWAVPANSTEAEVKVSITVVNKLNDAMYAKQEFTLAIVK